MQKYLRSLKQNKNKWFLIAIIGIAFVLRFYKLGVVPAGLEWDEVAIGYDSYSILKTGRDQFGELFPITFRSLDDYKPPIYNYVAVIPIALFGLTAFAVRFPSALFGTIGVFGSYLLVKELFRKHKNAEALALLSAFFFALSPWHLQFSRAAFEVNLSLTFIIFGVYSFLRGLRENKWLSFAAIFFGLGIFSYHSSRIVVPAILISMIFIFWENLTKKGKKLLIPTSILLLFFISFLPLAVSPQAQIRFRVTNFLIPAFVYQGETDYQLLSAQEIERSIAAGENFWARIFYNRRIAFINYDNIVRVAKSYLSHFDPQFLFVKGDMPLHHAPGFGLLYSWDIPFLILGIVLILSNYKGYRTRFIAPLFIWFLVAPIPASVTRQVPHAVRTLLILPTFHIFVAVGFLASFQFFRNKAKLFAVMFFIFAGSIFLFNVGYYLHRYYIFTNYDVSDKWLYGRQQAAQFVDSIKQNYDKVIVSTRLEQPHVFWLFYLAYDPNKYLAEGGTASGGWAEDRNKFDMYEFRPINYDNMRKERNILFVGLPEEFPNNAHVVQQIPYLNGSPGIYVVASQ